MTITHETWCLVSNRPEEEHVPADGVTSQVSPADRTIRGFLSPQFRLQAGGRVQAPAFSPIRTLSLWGFLHHQKMFLFYSPTKTVSNYNCPLLQIYITKPKHFCSKTFPQSLIHASMIKAKNEMKDRVQTGLYSVSVPVCLQMKTSDSSSSCCVTCVHLKDRCPRPKGLINLILTKGNKHTVTS